MIITTHITYRGKEIPISELKPNSEKRVLVECPVCNIQRKAFYKSIKDNQTCHRCSIHGSQLRIIKKGTKHNRLSYERVEKGLHIWKCDCGNSTKVEPSLVESGHTKSCGCLRRYHCSKLGKEMTKNWKGKGHPNWQGGISSERQRFNSSKKCKEWRINVFERDKYTCQHCGQVGGVLNAHHIKQWALYPKERLNIDNGLTLCEACHKEEHRVKGKKKLNIKL